MATTVVINSNPATTVSLKPANKTFASLSVAPSSNISLGQLTNVDVANVSDGQALIYNTANGKFEGGSITSGITSIVGGSF